MNARPLSPTDARDDLTAIIIPTFNEVENIENLVREIDALLVRKIIIVVDDNSPDGTGAVVDRLAVELPDVRVIHRPGKLGLGTAHARGFQLAISLGATLLVSMDADFSHAPRYIPELIAKSASADVIIGSRYVPGGGTLHFGLHRQILSRGANMVAKSALRMVTRDCTSGFRCYHRHVLEAIDPTSIVSDGYSFLVELLFRCVQAKYTIAEVPILFVNRQQGTSKIAKREITKAMATIWRLYHTANIR